MTVDEVRTRLIARREALDAEGTTNADAPRETDGVALAFHPTLPQV